MNKKIVAAVVAVAVVLLLAYIFIFQAPSFEPIEKTYKIAGYEGASAIKEVSITGSEHIETINIKSSSGALAYALITFVPKALAEGADDIDITTNGEITNLQGSSIIQTSAKNTPDEIALRISLKSYAKDICTVNTLLPIDFLSSLSGEQSAQLVEKLQKLDMNLSCDKANDLENLLSEELQNAFSED